jgi:hypothetical protein
MADQRELRADLDDLRDRVAALERRLTEASVGPGSADDFWALSELRARLTDDESTTEGAVLLVGSLRLPTGEPVSWQQGAGTAGLLEQDWSERVAAFAALGSPVRIELLRHVLAGTRSTAELAGLESLGTTGQLHHHLRQLLAAGWLRQSGRGAYEVPAARVVPLLVCIAAVER